MKYALILANGMLHARVFSSPAAACGEQMKHPGSMMVPLGQEQEARRESVWRTATGQQILLSQLDDDHLINIISYCFRRWALRQLNEAYRGNFSPAVYDLGPTTQEGCAEFWELCQEARVRGLDRARPDFPARWTRGRD